MHAGPHSRFALCAAQECVVLVDCGSGLPSDLGSTEPGTATSPDAGADADGDADADADAEAEADGDAEAEADARAGADANAAVDTEPAVRDAAAVRGDAAALNDDSADATAAAAAAPSAALAGRNSAQSERQIELWRFASAGLSPTVLGLSHCGIKRLDELVWSLDTSRVQMPPCFFSLTTLSLTHNALTTASFDESHDGMPPPGDALSLLPSLKRLLLGYNQITQIPETVMKLTKLETLSLVYNAIVEIPKSIEQMVSLKYLALDHNRLVELSPALLRLHNLVGVRWPCVSCRSGSAMVH